MGIYDRDYSHDNYGGSHGPQMRFMMPSPTPIVKYILIINIAVFIPYYLFPALHRFVTYWFAVFPATPGMALQVWRLVSYQFLHANIGHIFVNMLILYFFGPMLERMWGSKRFLIFYLVCGAMGGVLYSLLVMTGFFPSAGTLVGASGAIFGMLAAGAILFPRMQVYVFFGLFPLPFPVVAIILVVINMLNLLHGDNAGGAAAHLAGMAAGAVYVLWPKLSKGVQTKSQSVQWESKINRERNFQAEVDRILDKVHNHGIASLSRKEKKMLREATQREQQERGR